MVPQRRRCFATAKRIAVKRYVVKLSEAEWERLNTLIHAGKHPARQLTRARILLKADCSDAGEGWSDSQIATALDTSVDTVARTRQQLVEEGFEAVLVRKHSPASARTRIFDGAAEAALLHGSRVGRKNPNPICVHPRRTESGRPNSSIRFRT
jgi:hypothetical protein